MNDRFAKVPDFVVVSDLDNQCVRLYTWLALEIGGKDWERTVTAAAKSRHWQSRTVLTHAGHLAAVGLIVVMRLGRGASPRMRLQPQPARLTRTPNGRGGNGMDDKPLETEFHDTEDRQHAGATRATYAPDAHPLGSRAGLGLVTHAKRWRQNHALRETENVARA